MVVTVAVVVVTHNLAYGVLAGTLTAMMLFARRVAHLVDVTCVTDPDGTSIYAVHGELFFASSNDFVTQFDYADDPDQVVIDLSRVPHVGRLVGGRAGRGRRTSTPPAARRSNRRDERGERQHARPADRTALQPLTSGGTGPPVRGPSGRSPVGA